MNKCNVVLNQMHEPINKPLFRALSFLLAIGHAGLLMWEPNQYSNAIGGFNAVIGPLFLWAICSGVIFGVGFTPIHIVWKPFFSPYISFAILIYLTIAYLFV